MHVSQYYSSAKALCIGDRLYWSCHDSLNKKNETSNLVVAGNSKIKASHSIFCFHRSLVPYAWILKQIMISLVYIPRRPRGIHGQPFEDLLVYRCWWMYGISEHFIFLPSLFLPFRLVIFRCVARSKVLDICYVRTNSEKHWIKDKSLNHIAYCVLSEGKHKWQASPKIMSPQFLDKHKNQSVDQSSNSVFSQPTQTILHYAIAAFC